MEQLGWDEDIQACNSDSKNEDGLKDLPDHATTDSKKRDWRLVDESPEEKIKKPRRNSTFHFSELKDDRSSNISGEPDGDQPSSVPESGWEMDWWAFFHEDEMLPPSNWEEVFHKENMLSRYSCKGLFEDENAELDDDEPWNPYDPVDSIDVILDSKIDERVLTSGKDEGSKLCYGMVSIEFKFQIAAIDSSSLIWSIDP